jgi:hypothetical protein
MAVLTVQTSAFTGINHTYTAADVAGDSFLNPDDNRTFLLYKNANVTARTLTIAGNATSKPGFGDISAADMGETVTIPGSGTNGGECMVGPFPAGRFNDTNGRVAVTYSAVTNLSVAVVKLPYYS